MGRVHAWALVGLGIVLALGWFLVDRSVEPERGGMELQAEPGTGLVGGPLAPAPHLQSAPPSARVGEDIVFTPEDVRIFEETMDWARDARLDTLPLGEMIVRIGRRFVGEPYTPHTLDLPGPERLIINLREFDCVTYVESVLAMARVIRAGGGFERFADELRTIRYRDGEMDGYTSRLHYFSEWIQDNDELGLVRDITDRVGGRPYNEVIDFMSTHADAYGPLKDNPERVERIREIERQLTLRIRIRIPETEIGDVVDGIRNGDIIAATSSVEGLDVAHTGFALWLDGRLHLMHAPLVGRSLEISDLPLAVRILGIDGQDGIMVARPL